MKIFGYVEKKENDEGLMKMNEITFQTEPEMLRKIAGFFMETASDMEKWKEKFGHNHFKDGFDEWNESWPDIVISK